MNIDGQACEKVRAAFDIGSGTTKLKIYKVDTCKNKIIEQIRSNEGKICEKDEKISFKEDLNESKVLSKKIIKQAQKILNELKSNAIKCGAEQFSGVATSVFRQAVNGAEVVKSLEKSGVKVSIISQNEEAILGFNGAINKLNLVSQQKICVWDIGGSSMQIVCSKDPSVKIDENNIYMSDFASIPFKNIIFKTQNKKGPSPNPVSLEDYLSATKNTIEEAKMISVKLGKDLSEYQFYGIGGVHFYAISELLKKSIYTQDDLSSAITERLNKNDQELGGGEYVDTMVSNLILVNGLMKNLKINKINALKINLTEGLAVSNLYW